MYATLHNTVIVNSCKKLSYDKYMESMFKVYYKTYKIIGSVHVISTKLESIYIVYFRGTFNA